MVIIRVKHLGETFGLKTVFRAIYEFSQSRYVKRVFKGAMLASCCYGTICNTKEQIPRSTNGNVGLGHN